MEFVEIYVRVRSKENVYYLPAEKNSWAKIVLHTIYGHREEVIYHE